MELARLSEIEAIVDARAMSFSFFHLMKKERNSTKAKKTILALLPYLTIVSVSEQNLLDALHRDVPKDLEDGVQLESALSCEADYLITGDRRGFRDATIPAISAIEFLKLWNQLQ